MFATPLAIAAAGQATPATITFHFSNPALLPGEYTMVVHEDGSGHYHSEPGSSPAPGYNTRGALPPQTVDRDMTLSEPLRAQLFSVARKNHLFATECDAKRKNIAFTGTRTFSYAGPNGAGSCSFNFAREAQVQVVAEELQAVSETLEQGEKLELLLNHDKLGLDEAVGLLTSEQADGRALELQNLAPVLRAIADNEAVLNRTRARALALLTVAPVKR